MSKGIRELQRLMNQGETTSRRITETYLARIDQVDRAGPALNAVLELNPDAAEIADALDNERRTNGARSLLHGVPVILKANIDTADRMTTTAGSLALEGSIAPRDAFLVERLRDAGAVILGKANLSEWANFRGTHSISGWSSLGGQTRNPYDPRRSPCGSSSGSAVAVAAGMCAVSVGTETDGSIVCPAHICGVVGIKPTLGVVSRSGIIPIAHSQDTAGPMARSVEDAAILLNVLAGADPRDPSTSQAEGKCDANYTTGLHPDALRGVRLGVARNYLGDHPKIDAVFERAISILSDLGAVIIDPANIETAGEWRHSERDVMLYEFKHDLNLYLSSLGDRAPVKSLEDVIAYNKAHADRVVPHFGQELMELAQTKGPLTEKAYCEALAANQRLTRDEGIDATLRRHRLDAIIAPTGRPAWLIDEIIGDVKITSCSSVAAIAGYPHVTVPAGLCEGLPVGLSFFATAWDDAKLISYAFAFEQTRETPQPTI